MSQTELCFTSAGDLAARIRRRDLSPVERTRAVLDRIERVDGRLGAYVRAHSERAMDHARLAKQAVMAKTPLGPLHGVPGVGRVPGEIRSGILESEGGAHGES